MTWALLGLLVGSSHALHVSHVPHRFTPRSLPCPRPTAAGDENYHLFHFETGCVLGVLQPENGEPAPGGLHLMVVCLK